MQYTVNVPTDTAAKKPNEITESDYKEVPFGYYMCFINGCERTESKAGKPMLKVTLKIASACNDAHKEFAGRYMWVYQMLTSEFGQRIAKEWEEAYEHFPRTPLKVSKYEKVTDRGNSFTNYRLWLTDAQEDKINA